MDSRRRNYFAREEGAPAPLTCTLTRPVRFREVDLMGYVWFGHYAALIEDASTELLRQCGLSFSDFMRASTMAPVMRFHVDYRLPLRLGETCTIRATLVWTEAARINLEFEIRKEDGRLAATACTVQIFADGATGEPCFVPPPLHESMRTRWKNGDFAALQKRP